jgi:hypothetical protein
MDWLSWFGWFGGDDYEFAREVVQRGTAALYVVAFVSAANQFPVLLGERGLLPAPSFLRRASYRDFPSIFHWRYSDRLLLAVAWSGAVLAATLVLGLPQLGPPWLPLLAFLVLWALYLSIVNIGQTFYGFGWESLLVEAGFVVAFLGSNEVAPPILVIFFLRWLLFRLEFGAGMIKIRGGSEWRDLTAMYYHHETQPMPNPVSWFAHHNPAWFHRCEVLGNHFVQLVVPWFLFAPQPVASIAATLIILSQLFLVLTGNFSWLNWITIVVAFSGISDGVLRAVLPWVGFDARYDADPIWWIVLVSAAFVFLVVLSYRPLRNLFARRQLMNASFNRYHLVNAYGAFGTITKERNEVIIEGTNDEVPGNDADWRPYEFKGKPGDPARMPPQVAPYHLRLDWLMWFLALGSRDTRWFQMLLLRLLEGDRRTLKLLSSNPFPDGPPRWIRAQMFLYRFSTRAERREQHVWWVRVPLGLIVAPVTLQPDTRG